MSLEWQGNTSTRALSLLGDVMGWILDCQLTRTQNIVNNTVVCITDITRRYGSVQPLLELMAFISARLLLTLKKYINKYAILQYKVLTTKALEIRHVSNFCGSSSGNVHQSLYRGADKSLARPDWRKIIERSPFFVRRGGHCCRGDLVGRTTSQFFFLWVACKSQSMVTVACFLPGRAKDLSAPRYKT